MLLQPVPSNLSTKWARDQSNIDLKILIAQLKVFSQFEIINNDNTKVVDYLMLMTDIIRNTDKTNYCLADILPK